MTDERFWRVRRAIDGLPATTGGELEPTCALGALNLSGAVKPLHPEGLSHCCTPTFTLIFPFPQRSGRKVGKSFAPSVFFETHWWPPWSRATVVWRDSPSPQPCAIVPQWPGRAASERGPSAWETCSLQFTTWPWIASETDPADRASRIFSDNVGTFGQRSFFG